jgi:hypothetical protein
MLKEVFKKRDNQFMLGLIAVSLMLLFFGLFLLNDNDIESPKKIPNSVDNIIWSKYENKKFNFTVFYPEHFNIFEGEIEGDPAINLYYRIFDSELPLNYVYNQSHFSIYPLGLAFGGANLTYIDGEFKNSKGLEFKTKEFRTTDGETWGVMYIPQNTPKGWNETGFIWISSRLKNLEYECLSNGVKSDAVLCNILEGDQIFQKGDIDNEFLNISKEILNKINFN